MSSAVDQAVINCFTQEHYYYRTQYDLALLPAMEALAGHDPVYLDDQPLQIEQCPFGLKVKESGSSLVIAIDTADIGSGQTLQCTCLQSGLIVVAPDLSRALVMRFTQPAQHSALARFILQHQPTIPLNDVEQVRSRIDSLRQYVPVKLPTTLGGESVDVTAQQIILLRARSNGQLDVALHVRDTEGRTAEPGTGLLCYPGKQDGKSVQFRRDASAEVSRARQLIVHLNLDREVELTQWIWRVSEFEDILGLLERVEAAATNGSLEIIWDESSVSKIGVVGSLSPQNVRVEIKKDRDWFGLKGSFRVGDSDFQLHEVLDALRNKRAGSYLEIQPGQWASISDEFRTRLLQLRDIAHRNRKKLSIDITSVDVLQELDDGQIDFQAARAWKDNLKRLKRSQDLNPVPPEEFVGTLRDYQLEGYRWLRRLAEWGVGGCLADDMGLGKTIQILAVLIDRAKQGPTLVIAPTSVGFNWHQESERFAPTLNATLYRETSRKDFLDGVGPGDVVICSYGLALRDEEHLSKIK
jgi:hypothetical protein